MKKVLLSATILLLYNVVNAQLLTWSPQFPNDNSTIIITVDATKGNQGLSGFTGAVYMHFGVITNLSTSTTNWRDPGDGHRRRPTGVLRSRGQRRRPHRQGEHERRRRGLRQRRHAGELLRP